ncbi:MAG: hypothetical protein M5R36_15685 [Deltaproteobacteria bacterium]|nr:hypothetical protein [Deltaproteobacteria bacterium]
MSDRPETKPDPLDVVRAYHQRTKHHYHRYARALGYMDWETQPDPFRRYDGAELLELDRPAPTPEPRYRDIFVPGRVKPAPFDRDFVGRLFFDALAISAWKQYGDARWSLRVNPSSGNLHPTESYLVCGPVPGLGGAPGVFHYQPFLHALERRATFSAGDWEALRGDFRSRRSSWA